MAVNRVFSLNNHNRQKQTSILPRHSEAEQEPQQLQPQPQPQEHLYGFHHQQQQQQQPPIAEISSLQSLQSSQQPQTHFAFPEDYEDEMEMSILSSSNLDSGSHRSIINRLITSNAAYTNDLSPGRSRTTPQKLITLPKKLFKYIYSISSFIFALLTLGFVSVTPLDVIVQTSGTTYSGIKMFIVIIVCVVFLFLSTVLYLSRIVQYKSHMNEIPTYSVYIPDENDFPRPVFQEIDRELRLCIGDIRLKAGPLFNKSVVINHAGVSPPHYIQECYKQGQSGTLFPPETIYEDIIRSLGDKFIYDAKAFTQTDLPNYLTFREIILYLGQTYNIRGPQYDHSEPDLKLLVQLYEKFRFSNDLIQESDLFYFMVEFDKLGQMWHGNYQTNIAVPSSTFHKRRKSSNKSVDFDNMQPDTNYLQPQSSSNYRRSSSALAFDDEYNLYDDDDGYNSVGDEDGNTNGIYQGDVNDYDEYQFYHQQAGSEFFDNIAEDEGEGDKSSFNSVKMKGNKKQKTRSKSTSGGSINSSKSFLKSNSQFLMTPIIAINKNSSKSDNASISSSKSVVRNKIAMTSNFSRRSRPRSINDDQYSMESSNSVVISKKSNSVSVTPAQSYLNLRYEDPASSMRHSGYMSDSEHERDDDDDHHYVTQDPNHVRDNDNNGHNDDYNANYNDSNNNSSKNSNNPSYNSNNNEEDGEEEQDKDDDEDFYQFRKRNRSN